jgi:hypothetical protein
MIYPSVTQVLQPWADFSHIPPAVLEAASARGTLVHDICANIARGLLVMNTPTEVEGYVNSFRRWFDLMVADVLLVEERQVDVAFGFHWQNDLIARAKHGEILLIDLKTPVTKIKTWRLQLSAYRHLAVLNGVTPTRTGSLQLNPEGKIAKMNFYDNSLTDFNHFLSALNLYRFFNTK